MGSKKEENNLHSCSNKPYFFSIHEAQYICQNGNKVIMRSTNDLTAIMG
jgi:hypothetical protein